MSDRYFVDTNILMYAHDTSAGEKHERAKALAGAALLPEEKTRLFAILSGIVSGAGAPWVALSAEMRDTNRRAMLAVVKNGRVRSFIEDAFADVNTAHDLRGLAVILARGLDSPRSSSSVTPLPAGAIPSASFATPPAPVVEL